MKYVFLALLAVTSVIHLIHSYQDKSEKRRITKPFLLIFILAYYLCSTSSPYWLLIAALATSWLGDVLLIPKGNKWFAAGGISFLFSHIFFVVVYVRNVVFSSVNWFIVVPVAAVYITVVALILKNLKPHTPKIMFVPMFLYLLMNATMNVFALMQLMSVPSVAAAVAYAGAILFFISDCTLYLVRFYPKKDLIFKRHFTVMLTYILGELLITQGIIMLGQ